MEIKLLDIGNFITIIGWIVSFALGLLSALIVQKRGKLRKVLAWSLVSESDLLSRETLDELEAGFGVPIRVLIRDREETELSTIRVRVLNSGNVELQNLTLHFKFGPEARVYVGRYIGDLGVFRKKLKLEKHETTATLEIMHINPAQEFEVEFLVSKYRHDHFTVDMAEPGIIDSCISNGTMVSSHT